MSYEIDTEEFENGGRQCVSAEEATRARGQHTTPCSDCPWSRKALPRWLGALSVDEWLQAAHGEAMIECHTRHGAQCAGSAIYRANVCKIPRVALRLPADEAAVFGSPMEFRAHHDRKPRK